tara:strand:- start:717 stop:1427 length:711 start_codon:yes stop_codon:yes gene_type:complete
MKDQLELFQVLSTEQKNEVNRFVERQNNRVDDRIETIEKIVRLLKEAGFKQGGDFIFNYEVEQTTSERSFGWGEDAFKQEVTFNTINGGVYLIHKRFYNGQLITTKSNVSAEGSKLECYSITPQYRAYKPTSLLVKLNEYNDNQQWKFDNHNKKKSIVNYTVDKYSKLYPNANVKIGTMYSGRSSAQSVLVEFSSGSWVELSLGWDKDKESIHKKFDAKVDNLKGMDLLNHFNQQS